MSIKRSHLNQAVKILPIIKRVKTKIKIMNKRKMKRVLTPRKLSNPVRRINPELLLLLLMMSKLNKRMRKNKPKLTKRKQLKQLIKSQQKWLLLLELRMKRVIKKKALLPQRKPINPARRTLLKLLLLLQMKRKKRLNRKKVLPPKRALLKRKPPHQKIKNLPKLQMLLEHKLKLKMKAKSPILNPETREQLTSLEAEPHQNHQPQLHLPTNPHPLNLPRSSTTSQCLRTPTTPHPPACHQSLSSLPLKTKDMSPLPNTRATPPREANNNNQRKIMKKKVNPPPPPLSANPTRPKKPVLLNNLPAPKKLPLSPTSNT
jgi:hypothetical protein